MTRNPITEQYYPNEVSLYEFIAIIERDLPTFRRNMEQLKTSETKYYPEEWMRILVNWYEFGED